MTALDTISMAVGNVAVWAAFLFSLAFVVLYQTLARWWRSPFGVQAMVSSVSMTLLLGLGIWAQLSRATDYPGKLEVRVLVTLGLCALLVWRIVLLVNEQRLARSQLSSKPLVSAPPRKKNSMVLGNPLLSWLWWRAALIRGLRTAVVLAVPYVPASYTGAVPYLMIASVAAMGFVLSLLTSLIDLPEANGKAQPWWYAVFSRIVRTVAQSAVASIGSEALIQNVHWILVLQAAGTAAFGSLLLAVLSNLPETVAPTVIGGSISGPLAPNSGALAPTAAPVIATSNPAPVAPQLTPAGGGAQGGL